MLTAVICRWFDDEDETTNATCWSDITDVDSMDMDDMEAIFNEYV